MIYALVLTILIETALLYFAFKVRGQDLMIVVLAQMLTNPTLNLLLRYFSVDEGFLWLQIFVLEALVVVLEGFIYWRFKTCERPFLASLTANVVSFSVGLLVTWLL